MKKLLLAFSTALISCNLSSAADFVFKPALPFGTWWTAPARPTLDITAVNNGPSPATCEVTLTINTDFGDFLYRFDQSSTVAAGDSCTMSFGFDLEPGFLQLHYFSKRRQGHRAAQHRIRARAHLLTGRLPAPILRNSGSAPAPILIRSAPSST